MLSLSQDISGPVQVHTTVFRFFLSTRGSSISSGARISRLEGPRGGWEEYAHLWTNPSTWISFTPQKVHSFLKLFSFTIFHKIKKASNIHFICVGEGGCGGLPFREEYYSIHVWVPCYIHRQLLSLLYSLGQYHKSRSNEHFCMGPSFLRGLLGAGCGMG